jgi:hypothetical protein
MRSSPLRHAVLISLAAIGCDARSYDAACTQNQTSSSVPGTLCDESEVGQIACALPGQGQCTPLSSSVVQCARSAEASTGAPSWQSAFSCKSGQICYFFQPVDGAAAVSNAVGCGVDNFPLTMVGLPCAKDDDLACSFDTTAVLECKNGVWTTAESCGASKVCGGVACATDAPYCVGCQ